MFLWWKFIIRVGSTSHNLNISKPISIISLNIKYLHYFDIIDLYIQWKNMYFILFMFKKQVFFFFKFIVYNYQFYRIE